jgi:hypothetical protein
MSRLEASAPWRIARRSLSRYHAVEKRVLIGFTGETGWRNGKASEKGCCHFWRRGALFYARKTKNASASAFFPAPCSGGNGG